MENSELSLAIHEDEEILPKWFLGVEEKPEEILVEKEEIDESLCFIRKVHREAPSALRQIFRCLEPIDRLRSEGVCKFWKATLWEVNTGKRSGFRELSYEAVTNGRFRKAKITDRHLIALFKRFGKSVEVFKLNSFVAYELEDEYFHGGQYHSIVYQEPTFSPEVFRFLHLMPNLVSMDLSYDGNYVENFKTAENLVQIGNMPRLKCLKIASFWHQSTEGLREFLSNCPHLAELEIAWVDHEKLEVISELCPLLKSLIFIDFELLENDKLNNFFRKLKKLKKIVFQKYWCENFWDFEAIAALPDLEHLEVEGQLLTEIGLRTMANGCLKLESLVLDDPELSDQSLQMIGDLPSLKKFQLKSCIRYEDGTFGSKLTDETLIAIARRGKLEELIIPRSKKLTDSAIIEVIRTNKSLVRLNIFDCLWLTNQTFRAIVEELEGRWGNPPRELPAGEDDPRIFRLVCGNTRITWDLVEQEANRNNPWLRVSYWQ